MSSYKSKSNILFAIAVLLIVMLFILGKMHIYVKEEKSKQESDIVDRVLLFEIQSKRINCPTVWVEVYNDYTYEYYYTYGDKDEIKPRVGTYKYDVLKIIENNKQYINERIPYILTDNDGNKYDVYDNNLELNEFLDIINVKLDTCLSMTE